MGTLTPLPVMNDQGACFITELQDYGSFDAAAKC
jgi:hypothetical protein